MTAKTAVVTAVASGVFGYAGLVKLRDPAAFADAIDAYRLPLGPAVGPLALLLPAVELVVAGALWIPAWRRPALAVAGALTVVFLAALAQAATRGFAVDCGCFGAGPSGAAGMALAIVRDVALLGAIVWLYGREIGPSVLANGPRKTRTHTEPEANEVPREKAPCRRLVSVVLRVFRGRNKFPHSTGAAHSLAFLFAVASSALAASPIRTVTFTPPPGMARAELTALDDPTATAGILLLCPGHNGVGAAMFSPEWRALAAKHHLRLVGLAFASEDGSATSPDSLAYYYPECGSGKLLDEGLRRITGRDDMPLVIFGYSNGARFAQRYVRQHPKRIRAWATYAGGVAEEAPPGGPAAPPGVVACGLLDTNVEPALETFLAARRAKVPVCWLGIPGAGHELNGPALDWVRAYLDAELSRPPGSPDAHRTGTDHGLDGFMVECRFPSESIAATWERFGRPPAP